MCGIVGLHLKNSGLHPRLGELLTAMLDCMSSRGPDSAGLALYRDASEGRHRISLRGDGLDWDALGRRLASDLGAAVEIEQFGDAATLSVSGEAEHVLQAVQRAAPGTVVVGHGRAMEVVKDVGPPRDICAHYRIGERAGYQGIGHTRMATESAVTTEHSHPFAPREDMALVHNGAFSNPATVRRRLEREGIHCVTDNDSEVAARFIAHHVESGADLSDALRMVLKELDGFFTLLVTTETHFAVMRDSFACKPAVIAETDDYVAVASEYHALSGLPGVADATVFEPAPEEVYTWNR
ncbi:glutamine amidotransferase [Pseudonocardia sp. H11422]|uniref:glutamine amidotransferase n=1 Tax=Pseudonocardia sp. H11422 TaxID=2835866 RepID=UPI0020286E5C|nr:glutamine amidotransferase [Pseudonocardia sp. H11422]